MATVGELIVNLRASTAAFASDLGRATQLSFNTSREIERSFKRIGTAVTAAIATAATATIAFTAKSIEMADAAGKSAQALGLSVEQFTGLSYAAKISNVETGQLTSALTFMSRSLDKANQATNQGKAAHSALATIFRGNIPAFKTTDEAFLGIAQRLSELPAGFQKTALATQIFGRGALSLVPLLDEGAEGIEKLRTEAAALGVVISGETAANADRFQDTLTRLQTAVQGLGFRLAEALLPFLQKLSDQLLTSGQNAIELERSMQVLVTTVKLAATGVTALWGSLKLVGNAIAFLSTPLFLAQGWDAYTAAANSSFNELKEGVTGSVSSIQELWTPANLDAQSTAINTLGTVTDLGDGFVDNSEKITKFIDGLRQSIAEFGKSDAALASYRLGLLGASEAEKELGAQLAHRLELMKLATDNMPKPLPGPVRPEVLAPNIPGSLPAIDLEAITEEIEDVDEMWMRLNKTINSTDGIVQVVEQSMSEMFSQAIFRAGSLRQAFGNLLSRIAEVIFKVNVLDPLLRNLGGGGGALGFIGNLVGSIFGGFGGGIGALPLTRPGGFGIPLMASGGPLSAGMPAIVGEQGPELFIPSRSGMVVPNGAGGVTVNQYFDARGADAGVEERLRRVARLIHDSAVKTAVDKVYDNQRRTG